MSGYVANTGRGVLILAQGRHAGELLRQLAQNPPPLARITSFRTARVKTKPYHSFTIKPSRQSSSVNRQSSIHVLPDLATCPDCLREVRDPQDRRYGYAFTNCTQCGPRYTIIEQLPYDRPNTTMAGFKMCPPCRREYTDPGDRRHHAQPIACPDCGPRLTLYPPRGRAAGSPLDVAARALLEGRIVATKSLGGFQLACDATNERAVARLRVRKRRPAKPLALMCESPAVVRRFCRISPAARQVLLSPAAPIVLLPRSQRPGINVAASVAPGNSRLGVMVGYTPLHAVLFRRLRALAGKPAVLVMTSANRKDDPITAGDEDLTVELSGVLDAVLTHDRPIANPCDDSVVTLDRGQGVKGSRGQAATRQSKIENRTSAMLFVRRARGYAPQPLVVPGMFHVKHPVLAVGSEYKNVFALATGNHVFLSPHIGTVATARGERFWLDTYQRLMDWTGIRPEAVACDLHPDYASTRLAERISGELGVPLLRVQHHHAHVLSVMAEHGLSGPVLGLAFDGTGYGTDGAIWGGEFLLVEHGLNWSRVGHLGYLRLADAGSEVADPRRVARAYLRQASAYEGSEVETLKGPGALVDSGLLTSSLGRLFDAVAAITGVCATATFDGQAPVALEAAADPRERGNWPVGDLLDRSASPALIRPEPLLCHVSRETSAGVAPAAVAAKFHNTIALAAVALADSLCRQYHARTVCLSGGSFHNELLRGHVVAGLRRRGRRVAWNLSVPLNDGGIALGQVAAAAQRKWSSDQAVKWSSEGSVRPWTG